MTTSTASKTQIVRTLTRKAKFRVGDFVGIQGWHPYCVAFIESLTASMAVVEHEGMTFSIPTSQLVQVKAM